MLWVGILDQARCLCQLSCCLGLIVEGHGLCSTWSLILQQAIRAFCTRCLQGSQEQHAWKPQVSCGLRSEFMHCYFCDIVVVKASHRARPRFKEWENRFHLLMGEASKYCNHCCNLVMFASYPISQ